MKYLILLLTLANSLACHAQETTAVIGRVTLVTGEVEIARNGQRISAQRRTDIMEGDTLATGANGAVHIRFIDDALIAMRCKSTLNIQQYKAGTNEIVELDLVEGSIRSIAGTVGTVNYILHTDSADVRVTQTSTDFSASDDSQSGTSFSVFSGSVKVENNFGALDLGADGNFDFAEVESDQPPTGLPFAPNTIACD